MAAVETTDADKFKCLDDLPKDYTLCTGSHLKRILPKYEQKLLMDAALSKGHVRAQETILMKILLEIAPYDGKTVQQRIESTLEFWQLMRKANAIKEFGVGAGSICTNIREIVMRDHLYGEDHPEPKLENVNYGYLAIQILPGLDTESRKWQLDHFIPFSLARVFKKENLRKIEM